jgi:hypothetical protein
MSMIFEFPTMAGAEAFVREVKERFGLDGQAFKDDEIYEHAFYPFKIDPPAALVDRVWAEDAADVTAIKHRFNLTATEIEREACEYQQTFKRANISTEFATRSAAHLLAEERVDNLAQKFGGKFIGT